MYTLVYGAHEFKFETLDQVKKYLQDNWANLEDVKLAMEDCKTKGHTRLHFGMYGSYMFSEE